ncbi:PorP/SprF family type IX secretion system membrane protein [Lewinella sp. 4G2]|uniref:PorP/SprF family type IX secretion system membrane protein n=1 Tax=Lewinella sp. 4G2 TaxID=1803372 RepID=UPI0007B490FE|nr:PorP/SprF family type IX secretion system membrane protein [Lewinella sp. 4G2]OAV45384.1 hypothetical protein A3850_013170 [Lewinella sp. 4G2]
MKYFRLVCLVCALAGSGSLFSQQLSLFTQYRENATIINPAALEADFLTYGYDMTFGANYRKQWAGIQNSPTTQIIRGSFVNPSRATVNITAGGYLLNDQTGPTGYTGAYGRIGTVISQDPEYYGISVGLSAGYVGYRVKASELVVRDADDFLIGADRSQGHPDIGLGVYGYSYVNDYNLLYAGLSIPQVFGFDVTFQDENGDFSVQRLRHYYAMAGWYWFTSDESFLEVSSWVKYVEGAPLNADLSLRYQLPSAPYLGAGISTAGNFHFEAGINVGQSYNALTNFRLGYGYDYSFSSFGPSVGGTHEIQLAVALTR